MRAAQIFQHSLKTDLQDIVTYVKSEIANDYKQKLLQLKQYREEYETEMMITYNLI